MNKKQPQNLPQPSDTVKVAKISAVQAVIVALVAGVAGIAGTAGLRYVEHSSELAQKDREIEALKIKSQGEIDSLRERLQQAVAVSSLRRAKTALSQEQCYERLNAALSAIPNANNYSASLREPSDAGSRAGFGGLSIRFLCDPSANLLVVAVAGTKAKSEPDRIADEVIAVLQK